MYQQVETEKLFNNIGDIVTVNTEFWKGYLVRVLDDARTTMSLLNPSLLKLGFQKVRMTNTVVIE